MASFSLSQNHAYTETYINPIKGCELRPAAAARSPKRPAWRRPQRLNLTPYAQRQRGRGCARRPAAGAWSPARPALPRRQSVQKSRRSGPTQYRAGRGSQQRSAARHLHAYAHGGKLRLDTSVGLSLQVCSGDRKGTFQTCNNQYYCKACKRLASLAYSCCPPAKQQCCQEKK